MEHERIEINPNVMPGKPVIRGTRLRGQADIRIEPIPCGEREWETEQGRPILDMAREEGTEISIVSPD